MKIKLNIKNVLILSGLAIIITSISLFFINTSFAANMATIAVETANIRESADTNSTILELLNKGESVEILETLGEWSKIKYKNIVGYLRNDLLSIENGNLENATNTVTETGNTTAAENGENTIAENVTENVTENAIGNVTGNGGKAQDTTISSNAINEKTYGIGKYKAKEDTALKVIPLIHAMELEKVTKGTEVEITDIMNKWAFVKIQDKQGWIALEKLEKIEEIEEIEETQTPAEQNPEAQPEETPAETVSKIMYVNSESVNVRSLADRNSEVVTTATINTQVEVIAEENEWSKVRVSGYQGYILSSLLSNRKQETSRSLTQSRLEMEASQNGMAETTQADIENSGSSSIGEKIVEYAKQFIGTRYQYGGSSPTTGFDCSGFTQYVFAHFGIGLPRTSGEQAKVGVAVSRANLSVGDLVIYNGHVAIYVGNGNVIHSPKPGASVCIVPIDRAAYGCLGGRRIN